MFNTLFICLCVLIAIIDLKTYRIPDILLLLFIPLLLLPDGNRPPIPVSGRLMAACLSFIFFGSVWRITQGIGFGDVKYAAVLGCILGIDRTILALLYTALLGITVYVLGIFVYRWSKTTKIPFGPFLSAGAILSLKFSMEY